MAGETALARQLKKLAVPQTTVLIQDKIKKSFLFDHRDAAGLDRDILFSYGTNGLEKLCLINSEFSTYESSLFSITYKDFQRSVQTKEVNAELDKKITRFLKMMSPYFLLRGAHEALEWLVYRFHVHMYNVDDLVTSALPHYNTSTFVRVVQLLDLNEGSRWFWLKPIQKSGVHLDYSAILNRFLSDEGFRKLVCEMAPSALAVFRNNPNVAVPVISFSMITAYNAFLESPTVEETLISMLFPYVLKGLKSNFSKYIAASYLVVSQIVLKVKLTSDVIENLLVRVFQLVREDLATQALYLLLLVFQHQEMKTIPKKVHSAILSSNDSVSVLCDMTCKYEAHKLTKAMIKRSLSNVFAYPLKKSGENSKKQLEFLKNFLTCSELKREAVTFCFNFTLKKFVKCSSKAGFQKSDAYYNAAKTIFRSLERKYPDFFDQALKDYYERNPKPNRNINFLISHSVCDIRHKMGNESKTPFVIGLNHANPQLRKNSILQLIETSAEDDFSDVDFFASSLYDRLLDDNPSVVQAVLAFPEIILRFLDKAKVLSAFEEIFQKNIKVSDKWYPVLIKCLHFILQNYCIAENPLELLPFVVKFIFPVTKNTVEGFKLLLESNIKIFFMEELKSLESAMLNEENYVQLNCEIIESLKHGIDKMDADSKNDLAVFLSSRIPALQRPSFVSFYVLSMHHLIITDAQYKTQRTDEFLQVVRFYISSWNKSVTKNDLLLNTVVSEFITSTTKKNLPVLVLLYSFKKIIVEISASYNNSINDTIWPNTKAEDYAVLSKLFVFCIFGLNSFKGALREHFQNMLSVLFQGFTNMKRAFKFLCTKWVSYEEEEPLVLRLSSLKIAFSLSNNMKEKHWFFEDEAIFFCLLKAVSDLNSSISHTAMSVLYQMIGDLKVPKSHLYVLADQIKLRFDEIRVDSSQLFCCIGTYLKSGAELLDMKKSDKTKRNSKESELRMCILNEVLKLLNQADVPLSIKHTVLLCLKDIDAACVLLACVPLLETSLSKLKKDDSPKETLLEVIGLILKKFNPSTAKCLLENSEEAKALFDCLRYPEHSVQKMAIEVLSKEFFSSLPSVKMQLEIFHLLLDLYMDSSTSLNSKVNKVLRKLCSYAYIFLKHFQEKELNISRGSTLREAKKSRTGQEGDTLEKFENGPWKKMTVFLELMQNKSKLLHMNLLIPDLFNLLNKSLDLENQAPVEYIRQLILSVIFNCCQLLGSGNLDERQFQVELIVQCIRSSTNAKTHQQSLLLLNLAARMFPDYVLSNVMSIFTFMGSSLVRQDDSYSFQVISQTIETVVPSLLEASNQQAGSDVIQVVASVIRVFVDSLVDIPSHRQLPLFTKLLSTLDPSQYLWIPIGQICDQYAAVFHNIVKEDSENWKISPALEFAVNLHKQFSPSVQIDTCIELANFLFLLPDSKQQLNSDPKQFKLVEEPFNFANRDEKQLQIYKHNVLMYIKIWLSSQEFLSQVSELNVQDQHSLVVKYQQLMEAVLKLLQDRMKNRLAKSGDKNITNQIQILYDLVHTISSLLPCSLFINVIRSLLKSAEVEIQIKAIEFLNAKLEQQVDLEDENKKAVLKLLKPLLMLIATCINDETGKDKNASTLQAAMYSLHLICKLIGAEYPSKFYKVLPVSIQILTNCDQPELMVSALLCLAQLCRCLNVDILPHLNSFMPVIVNVLQDKRCLELNECLVLGIIAALCSIIENLGVFLSSYMEDILTGICRFSVLYNELGKKNICEKLEMLQSQIAKEIALRVLLGAIQSSYCKMTSETSSSAVPLMKMLTAKLDSSSYEDILASAPELQKFFLSSLDFRNSFQDVPLQEIDSVEDNTILSFKTFVMKLSVSRFRTLFQKVYQWATTTIEDQEQKLRVFTFYKLTFEFSKSLKSLFTQMSKYFFRHISTVLDSNSLKSKPLYFVGDSTLSFKLLCNAIDTLNYCFMYAEDQFMDKENFEILQQSLVDQIENLSFEDQFADFIENHLSSCIAHFMSSVSDNALWKSLNYQILLKTRHSSAKVRFGSLQVIQEVVSKMGENYLVLLPESIPFLAEIMEDESAEVEQECQNVIIEMEKILGEPIRKYF